MPSGQTRGSPHHPHQMQLPARRQNEPGGMNGHTPKRRVNVPGSSNISGQWTPHHILPTTGSLPISTHSSCHLLLQFPTSSRFPLCTGAIVSVATSHWTSPLDSSWVERVNFEVIYEVLGNQFEAVPNLAAKRLLCLRDGSILTKCSGSSLCFWFYLAITQRSRNTFPHGVRFAPKAVTEPFLTT